VYKTDALPPKICEYCLGNLRYIKAFKAATIKSYNQFNFYVKSAQYFQNKGETLAKWPAQPKCKAHELPMSETIVNFEEYSNENHEIFSNDLKTLFPQIFMAPKSEVKDEEELILTKDVAPAKKKCSKRSHVPSQTKKIFGEIKNTPIDTEMWDGDDTRQDSSESDTEPVKKIKISVPTHNWKSRKVECDMCGKILSYYHIQEHLNIHLGGYKKPNQPAVINV
jgi:hypothetical protein